MPSRWRKTHHSGILAADMCPRPLHHALLGLAVSAGFCSAVDRHVSTTGLDTNPGTFAQPWRTIQKAASLVVAGDTVFIRGNGGVYTERVSISSRDGTVAQPIVFKTYPGDPLAAVETTISAAETEPAVALLTHPEQRLRQDREHRVPQLQDHRHQRAAKTTASRRHLHHRRRRGHRHPQLQGSRHLAERHHLEQLRAERVRHRGLRRERHGHERTRARRQ